MKMINMTAVEWLQEKLKLSIPEEMKVLRGLVVIALEMEKEQIMQAYKFNAIGEPDGAEHYYEMFYKKYNP